LRGDLDANWFAAVDTQRSESLMWPVPEGKLLRRFGYVRRVHRRRLHRGVDIGAPSGTPILAAKSGLVIYSDNEIDGYGNLVVMAHADGSLTWYAHCSAILVFPGQQIEQGETIAEVGATGRAQGPHLHLEYYVEAKPKDPLIEIFHESGSGSTESVSHK